MLRLFKTQSAKQVKDNIRVQKGLTRIYMFMLASLIISHLLSCGYLMVATYDHRNWLSEMVTALQGSGEDI